MFQLGTLQMAVEPLDARIANLRPGFVALVPALDLTQLPATTSVATRLLEAGCADIILAGPRASAFHEHIQHVIEQHGAPASSTPFDEVGDACSAALLGVLIHKSGVALCRDEPEVLDALQGAAEANGWTLMGTPTPAKLKPDLAATPKPKPHAKAKRTKPAPKPKLAAASSPKPKPKAKAKPTRARGKRR
jgi:hypothetical protein